MEMKEDKEGVLHGVIHYVLWGICMLVIHRLLRRTPGITVERAASII